MKFLGTQYSVWGHHLEKSLLEMLNTKMPGPLCLTHSFMCFVLFLGALLGTRSWLLLKVEKGKQSFDLISENFGLVFLTVIFLPFIELYMWDFKHIQNTIGKTNTVYVWLWKMQYWNNHLHHTHLKNSDNFRHEAVVLASLKKSLSVVINGCRSSESLACAGLCFGLSKPLTVDAKFLLAWGI